MTIKSNEDNDCERCHYLVTSPNFPIDFPVIKENYIQPTDYRKEKLFAKV